MLRKWIEVGAPDPRDGDAPTDDDRIDFDAAREHWGLPLTIPLHNRKAVPITPASQ